MKSRTLKVLSLICASAMVLGACGGQTDTGATNDTNSATQTTDSQDTQTSDHEPITMTVYALSYTAFEEALHKVHPEINIEFSMYRGYDTSDYCVAQIEAGKTPDIFYTRVLPTGDVQKANLYDLSGEEFINNISISLINDVAVDGGVYMLPTNYNFLANYYNKTLFDEHGWEVPTNFEELEELIPHIEAAGVKVSECSTQYLGSTFSYFFDTAAPDFIYTPEGQAWIKDFLAGEANASDYLGDSVEYFQRWIDAGLFSVSETPTDDNATFDRFCEGNTAFLFSNGNRRFTANEDGTGDEIRMMPYISETGEGTNIVVKQVNAYYGISKRLEDDPEKLADALAVLEFMATPEGMEALGASIDSRILSSLKGATSITEDSPLYEPVSMVDNGQAMELIYSGWEDYIADIGAYVYDWIAGEITGEEFLQQVDDKQAEIVAAGGKPVIADVEEDLDLTQAAQLVGAAFAEKSGADCALIPVGEYHGQANYLDCAVQAYIFADATLTNDVICTFNPLGWTKHIETTELTGAEINAMAAEGRYNTALETDTEPYPYVLVTKGGAELDDATTYTVVLIQEDPEKYTLTDTGVEGQAALREYIGELGVLNSETIVWK